MTVLELSLKKRLQLIAKERNLTPAEVWQNVIVERFLIRLCNSPYRSHFIWKGGTLLAKYVDLGRETKDLDFAIERLSNETIDLQKVFEHIVETEIGDGFIFKNPIVTPLKHFHMKYPGSQVKMEIHFGNARFFLFIDLGFGDIVKVREMEVLLLSNANTPLFEASVTLKCYPMEFIFAEKLETVIYRGSGNTRMKDFHDLYTLACTETTLDGEETKNAILAVFKHRQTPIRLPIRFSASGYVTLQNSWNRYHKSVKATLILPSDFKELIELINKWIIDKTNLM